jgi:hypothetical protein
MTDHLLHRTLAIGIPHSAFIEAQCGCGAMPYPSLGDLSFIAYYSSVMRFARKLASGEEM